MLKLEKKIKRIKKIFDIVLINYKFVIFIDMFFFLVEYFYLFKLLIKCLFLNIDINLNVLFFFVFFS